MAKLSDQLGHHVDRSQVEYLVNAALQVKHTLHPMIGRCDLKHALRKVHHLQEVLDGIIEGIEMAITMQGENDGTFKTKES